MNLYVMKLFFITFSLAFLAACANTVTPTNGGVENAANSTNKSQQANSKTNDSYIQGRVLAAGNPVLGALSGT